MSAAEVIDDDVKPVTQDATAVPERHKAPGNSPVQCSDISSCKLSAVETTQSQATVQAILAVTNFNVS